MALTINVDTMGIRDMANTLEGFSQRRMNAAIATAMTRTAREARDTIRDAMPRYLDRPTPYTLRGVFFKGASATRLEARVWFNNEYKSGIPQNRFLYPQVYGGTRNTKRFEKALQAKGAMPPGTFAVPTSFAKRDAYGGVANGQIAQIISQVGTELAAGYNRSISSDKLKRKRVFGRAGGQYVAVPYQRGKLKPGIYLAEGRDFGRMGYGRNGRMKPIFLFKQALHYTKRVPFYEMAEQVARQRFNVHLAEAIAASAARLAASSGE